MKPHGRDAQPLRPPPHGRDAQPTEAQIQREAKRIRAELIEAEEESWWRSEWRQRLTPSQLLAETKYIRTQATERIQARLQVEAEAELHRRVVEERRGISTTARKAAQKAARQATTKAEAQRAYQRIYQKAYRKANRPPAHELAARKQAARKRAAHKREARERAARELAVNEQAARELQVRRREQEREQETLFRLNSRICRLAAENAHQHHLIDQAGRYFDHLQNQFFPLTKTSELDYLIATTPLRTHEKRLE